jgi:hypothetical protein
LENGDTGQRRIIQSRATVERTWDKDWPVLSANEKLMFGDSLTDILDK